MVSRVYTPLVTPYNRAQSAGRPVAQPDDERRPFQLSQQEAPPKAPKDEGDLSRPSGGLRAVQVDRFQKIPLTDVLHDFQSTMNALGVSNETRSEVAAYLKVVNLQASKEAPEVPFIKHTLRTAAGALDQFIGNALGQPSHVVKEWVDALLLQDIDYHADMPAEDLNALTGQAAGAAAPVPADTPKPDKARLKGLIDEAKATYKSQGLEAADGKLQEALDLVADQNHPDWEGRIWQLRGKFYDKAGDWQQAVHFLDTAADKFNQANLPDKQAQALQNAAGLLDDHNQLDQARHYYRQAASLHEQTGDTNQLIRTLNDLGSASVRSQDGEEAVTALKRASTEMLVSDLPAEARSDILSNLGAAYRLQKNYRASSEAYRESLAEAKNAKDKTRYASSLQAMAGMLVEANQPEAAMKALQRLKNL